MSMMYILNLVGLHLKYYTDFHDVDEDKVTGVIYGERWNKASEIGITHREMHLDQTGLVEYVASSVKI